MAKEYFLYSSEQLKFMTDMEKRIGKHFRPGVVFNKGRRCNFTEISSSPTNSYSDTKIVCEGESGEYSYTPPTSS